MALPPSTANWHWKNKNVTRWGKEWFEKELPTLSVTGEVAGQSASISKVTYVEGDIELGQRKSKLITIYDCKIEAEWSGTTSDGTEVNGKLTIPEVSHEMIDGLSDYVYEWTLTTKGSEEVNTVFTLVKAHLPSKLEAKFAEFPAAIRDTHGRDLTVSADPSRSGTPAPASASDSQAASSRSAAAQAPGAVSGSGVKKPSKPLNTSTINVEATFMAAADDLYGLLTDEQRIPVWSRAPAQSKPQVGASFSLFGGGIKGEYTSLTPPKEIVQTWTLNSPTWPSGHNATLTTTLDQSSDSTKVIFSLSGVPKGLEDEIKRNLEGYYIHGLKSIGYVQIMPYELPSYPPPSSKREVDSSPKEPATKRTSSFIIVSTLIFVAAAWDCFIAACSMQLWERVDQE